MADYRCFFLDARTKFKAVREYSCTDDSVAVLIAMRLITAQKEFPGFEVWQRDRMVVSICSGLKAHWDRAAR